MGAHARYGCHMVLYFLYKPLLGHCKDKPSENGMGCMVNLSKICLLFMFMFMTSYGYGFYVYVYIEFIFLLFHVYESRLVEPLSLVSRV